MSGDLAIRGLQLSNRVYIADWLGETQILGNAKSVSLWQREFSKIVELCTFDLINYTRKYVKLDKMVKITTLDNLGMPRTEKQTIINKFLIK